MYPTNPTKPNSIFRYLVALAAFLAVNLGYLNSAHADSSVIIAWDSNSEPVAGYLLKQGTSSGTYEQTLDVGPSTTATVENLIPGVTYYFVVTAYNTAGVESPPSSEISYTTTVNRAPVAIDDSVTIDEGSTATISVLSNDSDPDRGPLPLSIQSAVSTSNGTTSIVGNNVIYTPDPGFYGADTFSYAITDGELSASATVTVNVQSTAIADDLVEVGLKGSSIGSATGDSRMFSDESWEVTGSGIGATGISDQLYFEHESRTGNFQALARIQMIASDGPAPEVGLMLRESFAADARFAMIAATSDAHAYGSRTTVGGSAAKTAVAVPAQFPDVWVLIQRTDDTIEFATSTDGVEFESAGSTVLSSLADEVKLGLFISSGMAGVNARAEITNYTVIDIAPSSIGTGLTGRYYAGSNFETLVLTRVENVNFDWGNAAPDPSVPDDLFSVQWSGTIAPQYAEEYTFYALAQGGIRLWVNGQLIIDNWIGNSGKEKSATITLEAGQMYDIQVEYVEKRGQASAILSWSSPSTPKEIIPVEVLYEDLQ